MHYRERYLMAQVKKDLKKKMVFVGGPRQVGKTTLAKAILGDNHTGYLNWDIEQHRDIILHRAWPSDALWVFDEIHKYHKWRGMLKGIYDQYCPQQHVLVTGSARLDLYRYGGDSLQGRYHYLRMHPLSVAELAIHSHDDFLALLRLSGFPEPFFGGSVTEAQRWSREYRARLIDEDVRSLEQVQDLGTLELLMIRLPALVGSPLSINALREDLQVSHNSVARWIAILERLYAVFRISPFGAPLIRAVKKEQKHYHMDWSLVEDQSFRFENLVACHLLKWVQFRQDAYGEDVHLRYFRDTDGREVDFILCDKQKPVMAVECKWGDTEISQPLKYFAQRFPGVQAWQISAEGKKDYLSDYGIRVAPALCLLRDLI